MSAKRAESDVSDYPAIWHAARKILRNTVASVHFDNHITNLEFKAVSGEIWTLVTPSPVSLEWLQTRLNGDIVRALENTTGTLVTVEFVVVESEQLTEDEQFGDEYIGEYRDERNKILQPRRLDVHTWYFRTKWRRLLGPLLSELVRELRQLCYHGKGEDSEQRDTTDTTYSYLAKTLGVSEPTIKRALKRDKEDNFQNKYLHYFIKNMTPIKIRKNGQIRTVGTRFTIWLDDELTPEAKANFTGVSK